MPRRRVIAWGTGSIGMPALLALIDHPEYDLVGLHAWSPEKVGRDAGEIAGDGPIGVLATNDVEELLSLQADCLVYNGNYARREAECIADVVPFLEAGTNLVTPALMDLIVPQFGRQEFVEPIERACARGGSSAFCGGSDPGYMTIGHLFSLLSIAGRIDSIHVAEIADLTHYGGTDSLAEWGFNKPLDYVAPMFNDEVGRGWHDSTLHGIASYLGVELEAIDRSWETASVDHDYEAAFGHGLAGMTAGVRWTMTGIYRGQPLIVYRKVERTHPDAGPDWERPLRGAPVGYEISINGDRSWDTVLAVYAYGLTGLHPVNAIGVVCDAPPGVLGQLDLPPFYSRAIRR